MHVRALLIRVVTLLVAVGGISLTWTGPAQAAPVSLTGVVVDAATDAGIAGAYVEVDTGPWYDDAIADTSGTYAMALEPGSYTLAAYADGYASGSVDFEVTESTTTIPAIELVALPDPVSVTGRVTDGATDAGIPNAFVEAEGPSYDDADTDSNGSYALALRPGFYTVSASANGYESGSVDFEVTASTTTIPTIELTALPAGLHVSVDNSTFGGPAANAQVSAAPSGGGTATVLTTDADGVASFLALAPGQYDVRVLAANGYVGGAVVPVTYSGGFQAVHLSASINLACEPASASTGLTNMGFENDLNAWTLGYQTETIQAVNADAFTTPWEGTKMARLGHSSTSADNDQPEGPNIMCQDFEVTDAQETFAFNVFTYDYTGFDEFRFDVVVTDPSTGETLAAYEQGAWGSGTQLKTSGWRGVKLDLSDHLGDTVRLTFRAGGTKDSSFAFWAYVDSAATLPPTIETSNVDVETTTGSVTTDPTTGQVTVSMPSGDPSDLTMTLPATCQDEETTPTAVSLVLNGTAFAGAPTTGGLFTVTIPEASITSGQLSVQVVCTGETTLVVPIGQLVLYDPSGIITNAVTGQPVVGAEVRLYKVPGWTPQGAEGPYPATSCQTNLSKAPDAPWSQPAPTNLGELVNPASPEISPNVNPFVTNNVGYYGWDVAEGCWYVMVEAAGYDDLTSPVVGVPTEVTDLDLTLQPKMLKASAAPSITGEAKVGNTLSASSGTWNTDGATFAYQWLRNGDPIQGATGSSYSVVVADASTGLAVRVTATKADWATGTATSGVVQVAAVAPPVVTPPVVTPPVVTPPVVTPPTSMASSTTKLRLPKKAAAGKRITAKVTVVVSAGAPATGKVVIKIGKKVVGTGTLKAGKVAIKLKKLKPGTYKLAAIYSGSTTVKTSTSKKVRLKVVRAAA